MHAGEGVSYVKSGEVTKYIYVFVVLKYNLETLVADFILPSSAFCEVCTYILEINNEYHVFLHFKTPKSM